MEEVGDASKVRKDMKSRFGSVVQAISDAHDFTFDAVINDVKIENGKMVITIFADPNKSFDLEIHDIVEQDNQWLLHTNNGLWAFRQPDEARAKRFLKGMKEAGVDD